MSAPESFKAVILVGGAQKGTRFRPLSLQLPKPLFPVAGVPLIDHHISQLCQLKSLSSIYLIGFYPADQFEEFLEDCNRKYNIPIRYLQEKESQGTAGGLLKFKNDLREGHPTGIFVLNADICGDLPISEMVDELRAQGPKAHCLILTTEATRDQSTNFGSVVIDSKDAQNPKGKVLHYVDKPTTFVSTHISCGIYLLRTSAFWPQLEKLKNGNGGQFWLETDMFPQMAANDTLYAVHTCRWWSQTKTAAAALYANRHYLRLYKERCPERLAQSDVAEIVGEVFIDPTATVHPTAKIGPNVSIGANAIVAAGVRVRESIILQECVLEEHCCVLHSIVGWNSVIGQWARVEGTPIAPNPNIPFAKLDNKPLFNSDGRLNPSLTILGAGVHVPRETVILNSVVLPNKDLRRDKDLSSSYKNQIIL
ncbi:nucleotidyl transferase domain-containing protein [Ditylenchus destructor]|uniref:Nucleotidyl transferase domain-containing protein n=1 Tax=Ditylenchus destructor TaxID=166010 RepID=A0AAD4R6Z3_9BILA|nr:nucleotidyl transferase domain-containing protein [Ditylenchus destructor]